MIASDRDKPASATTTAAGARDAAEARTAAAGTAARRLQQLLLVTNDISVYLLSESVLEVSLVSCWCSPTACALCCSLLCPAECSSGIAAESDL